MRLRRLQTVKKAKLEWRSYLLRPRPNPRRSLEKFRAYTQSWERPAADTDSGIFRVWGSNEGPPSHSIPPHLVAKAAAKISSAAFESLHEKLLFAYFYENRDITNNDTLLNLWISVGLEKADFSNHQDPALLQAVMRDHKEAVELGATGVPAVRAANSTAIIVGAHPYELYERWVNRLQDGDGG